MSACTFIADGGTFSVHTITNSAGAVVGEQALDPWGVRLQATGISLPCSGFVGKFGIREDSATGLVYMRNRWYDPQLQRFVSADPISISGGLNLYLYAGADPVNTVDLLGLEPGDNCGCPQKRQELMEHVYKYSLAEGKRQQARAGEVKNPGDTRLANLGTVLGWRIRHKNLQEINSSNIFQLMRVSLRSGYTPINMMRKR